MRFFKMGGVKMDQDFPIFFPSKSRNPPLVHHIAACPTIIKNL